MNPEGLSQGDVIKPLPVGVPVVPPTRLRRTTVKGATEVWTPTTDENQRYWLFTGQEAYVLVVSHSCDMDKKEGKGRVLVAAMRKLEDLDAATRSIVLAQERRSLMPLPAIPGMGDCYADLRLISVTTRDLLADDRRVASMTDDGLVRLQVQLAQFFLRLSSAAVDTLLRETTPAAD